uniref:Uncharacterized protein n=1 Tax=Plectus sambesii TaxID=2011161 RepID=A0A914WFN7_9BILA
MKISLYLLASFILVAAVGGSPRPEAKPDHESRLHPYRARLWDSRRSYEPVPHAQGYDDGVIQKPTTSYKRERDERRKRRSFKALAQDCHVNSALELVCSPGA